jgi:hypothetical protein
MRWAGHLALNGEMIIPYKILVGKREGMRPLGRRRCRWSNIKIGLIET